MTDELNSGGGDAAKAERKDDVVATKKEPASASLAPINEPDYVTVLDVVSGESMELPTLTDDNSLGLTTLTHAFPGAHGLKYKTEAGTTRALLLDPSGTRFYAPTTGWTGKTFTVIFNNPVPSAAPTTVVAAAAAALPETKYRSSSDQNAKRKKMMDDSNSSDSEVGDASTGGHHGYGTAKQKRIDPIKDQLCEEKEENHPSDLIVLGIPFKMVDDELRAYFEQFGKVVLCEIKKDNGGSSKGFGFIQFDAFESQLRVLSRPMHTIGGRRCQVKVPLSKKGDVRNEYVGIEHAKLFIGRLQEKTGENVLKDFFLSEARKIDPKASIIDTFIPKPFRSFAFITFSNPKIVRELIKKGDFIIDGCSVSVSSAAPKEETFNAGFGDFSAPRNFQSNPPRYNDWSRNRNGTHALPTNRFNEHAFVRPYPYPEQRKRTFDNAGYNHNAPIRMEPPFTSTNGSNPEARQQALASGFETLNLNQLPGGSHEMMNAFSQFLTTHQQQKVGPSFVQSREWSSTIPTSQNQNISQRRFEHGASEIGRNMPPRNQMPYSRPDDYFGL